jgi:hypothetical protein
MRCGTDVSSAWRSLFGEGRPFYLLHGAPLPPPSDSELRGAEAFLKDGPIDPAVDAQAMLLEDTQVAERRTLPRVLVAKAPPTDVPDLAGTSVS